MFNVNDSRRFVVVVDVRYDVETWCQWIRGRFIASHELEVAAERLEREVLSG